MNVTEDDSGFIQFGVMYPVSTHIRGCDNNASVLYCFTHFKMRCNYEVNNLQEHPPAKVAIAIKSYNRLNRFLINECNAVRSTWISESYYLVQ